MTWVEVVVVRVRRRVLGHAFVVLEGDMVQVTNKPLGIRMKLRLMAKVLRSRNLTRMAIRFLGQREPWRSMRNPARNSTGC
jgi:predicted glycosyltransferase